MVEEEGFLDRTAPSQGCVGLKHLDSQTWLWGTQA